MANGFGYGSSYGDRFGGFRNPTQAARDRLTGLSDLPFSQMRGRARGIAGQYQTGGSTPPTGLSSMADAQSRSQAFMEARNRKSLPKYETFEDFFKATMQRKSQLSALDSLARYQ